MGEVKYNQILVRKPWRKTPIWGTLV